MNAEDRIAHLERQVRRLTVVTVAVASFAAGAVLMGASGAGSVPTEFPTSVSVPADGAALVPGSDGKWHFVRSSPLTPPSVSWK